MRVNTMLLLTGGIPLCTNQVRYLLCKYSHGSTPCHTVAGNSCCCRYTSTDNIKAAKITDDVPQSGMGIKNGKVSWKAGAWSFLTKIRRKNCIKQPCIFQFCQFWTWCKTITFKFERTFYFLGWTFFFNGNPRIRANSHAWQSQHVRRKRAAKDFSVFIIQDAEEVTRLMEDEEFSAWCNKSLSDDSLDEDDHEGDESQRGGRDVDKISYLQLIHNLPLCWINSD